MHEKVHTLATAPRGKRSHLQHETGKGHPASVRNGGQAVHPRASSMSLRTTESIPFVKSSTSR